MKKTKIKETHLLHTAPLIHSPPSTTWQRLNGTGRGGSDDDPTSWLPGLDAYLWDFQDFSVQPLSQLLILDMSVGGGKSTGVYISREEISLSSFGHPFAKPGECSPF